MIGLQPKTIADTLHAAGIHFTGGTWLRLKGAGLDAISVNSESGNWKDHRTGDHGNFQALAAKLNFDGSGVDTHSGNIASFADAAAKKDKQSIQYAKNIFARCQPAIKSPRAHGWSPAAWEKEQEQYTIYRDAMYAYFLGRGLDPELLLPLVRFSTEFKSETDQEMKELGADFWFNVPMFTIGQPQRFSDGSLIHENISGLQRTYIKINDDGTVSKIGRRMIGKKGCTEILPSQHKISLPDSVFLALGIGEGFETVASFCQKTGYAGVACWDYSGVRTWANSIHPRENSPHLAFLVDFDTSETGQRESAAAVRKVREHEHGKAVYLLPPDFIVPDEKGNRDWNDLLKQAPDDFAAEIVKSWHKSDENMELAPIAEKAEIEDKSVYTGPKDAEVRQAIAEAVERHVAAEILKKETFGYKDAFYDYFKKLKEWEDTPIEVRKKEKIKKPKLPPILEKITTGVGKSHLIRELIQQTDLPLLILTRTHDLAKEYARAGAFAYHGRSNPVPAAQPKADKYGRVIYTLKHVQKNIKFFNDSDCFKHELICDISENNHIPALTACRNCEHGRKFMLENYDKKSTPYQDAVNWFNNNYLVPDNVPSCLWLGLQAETKKQRVVVAPNASFSDSLKNFTDEDGTILPRLVIVDELPDFTKAIEADSGNFGIAAFDAQHAIQFLESEPETDEKQKIIEDLNKAIELFKETTIWLGETIKDGLSPIPDKIVDDAKKLHIDWLPGATARWEKAEIKYGRNPVIPLRMAKALIESISTKTAFSDKGTLYLHEITALGEYIRKGNPAILLDATPAFSVEKMVEAKNGKIVQAIAKQHINLVHFNQYLHGKTHKNKEHAERELEQMLGLREQMCLDYSVQEDDYVAVLTHRKLCELATGGNAENAEIGYFGRDDIGQDRWKLKNLLIFGGPLFSPTTQASAYNAELMLMRLSGVKNLPDWSSDVLRDQEITVGGKVVSSKAPLPSDPVLKHWVLNDYARRVAQAIGRVRGVWGNSEKPINVWIAGGLPLSGLADHGIAVNSYRQEKPVDLREVMHDEAVKKTEVAIAALQSADKNPSYREVNRWLNENDLPEVRYDVWKSIVNKLSTGLNNHIYEPVDALLASLNSLAKVADWQGLDLSDVALNTWNAVNIDPEIKAAAEIVLNVSPFTDDWRRNRQKMPDD